MARKPRLDLDGFHHIVNRGVARSNVYRCGEDKADILHLNYMKPAGKPLYRGV